MNQAEAAASEVDGDLRPSFRQLFDSRTPRATVGGAAIAGGVGAAAALAVGELIGRILGSERTLTAAVGRVVIDNTPEWLRTWAIDTFGTADKLVLNLGILLVALGLGALVAIIARVWRWVIPVAMTGFAALGLAAAVSDPRASGLVSAIAAAFAVFVGTTVTLWLLYFASYASAANDVGVSTSTSDDGIDNQRLQSRRTFITSAAGVGLGALVLGTVGRWWPSSSVASKARELVVLPDSSLPPPPASASFDVEGITPLVTSNDDFYRIDTALAVPDINPDTWSLKFDGMVTQPFEITYDELLGEEWIESYITIQCVSNSVGGDLIGTAKWGGVELSGLLDRAGVDPESANQIVGRSADDFTVGFPTSVAFDGRPAMIALAMNDEPLPVEHGFPARIMVAGLYGYVSATKWLAEIELTTWDGFDAYWIPRGWSKEGPIKIASRIDVPRARKDLAPGPITVAGVAWAPTRGISRVQLQIDDDEWTDTQLATELSDNTWRQWQFEWNAESGEHTIRVRAIDDRGEVQIEEESPPAPDGATGYHERKITVS